VRTRSRSAFSVPIGYQQLNAARLPEILKIHRARQLLQETDLPIKTIAQTLGLESPFHFAKAFKQRTDVSPTQRRRGEIRRGLGPV